MSTTTITPPTVHTAPGDTPTRGHHTSVRRTRIWTAGLAAGAIAAGVTSLVAAVASAAGAEIAISGEPIPVSGFAMLTMIGAALGIALAKLAQRSGRPVAAFVKVTVALTALSIVPDLVVDTGWASRLLLAATHVIAATIIVPALAHRLEH